MIFLVMTKKTFHLWMMPYLIMKKSGWMIQNTPLHRLSFTMAIHIITPHQSFHIFNHTLFHILRVIFLLLHLLLMMKDQEFIKGFVFYPLVILEISDWHHQHQFQPHFHHYMNHTVLTIMINILT